MTLLIREIPIAPHVVRAEEGVWTTAGPERTRVILSSAATGGAFMLMEAQIDAPSYGPPYHVHTMEDEMFMVLEGELILVVNGVRHELRAGDVAFGPRNVPHRFESGPNGVRMIVMSSGDNFERFFPRYCEALNAGQMDQLPRIAAEHGIMLVNPA